MKIIMSTVSGASGGLIMLERSWVIITCVICRYGRKCSSSRSVCLSVCLFVYYYSRTTGYEAAYERYQQIQCYKGRKNNVAILLKRLRSRDMA